MESVAQHALVTGASGFVGINLLHELLQQGWQVSIFCRPESNLQYLPEADIRVHFGDLTDAASLNKALAPQPDCIFHCAADTSVWSGHRQRQNRVNIDGTGNVVAAAVRHGIGKLVYTSSFATWGFQSQCFDEHSPPVTNAHWINYVRSKAHARDIVLDAVAKHGLHALILCPGHILGPYDQHNWSRLFIMLAQQRLPGVPPGSGAFADVQEVARAHVMAASVGQPGEQYLLGGHSVSYLQLLQRAAAMLGVAAPQRSTPAWLLHALARILQVPGMISGKEPHITPEGAAMVTAHMQCDSSKAMQMLGYRQTAIDVLLRKTLDWLAAEQLLQCR